MLALAAMVCNPQAYEPNLSGLLRPVGYCRFDALRMDTEGDACLAQEIMEFILKAHKLTMQMVVEELDGMGDYWKDGLGPKLDISCLEKYR